MSDGLSLDNRNDYFGELPEVDCEDCAYRRQLAWKQPCKGCLGGVTSNQNFVGKQDLRYYVIVKKVEEERDAFDAAQLEKKQEG